MNKILLKGFLIVFTIGLLLYLVLFQFVFHEMSREIIFSGAFGAFCAGLGVVFTTKKRMNDAAKLVD